MLALASRHARRVRVRVGPAGNFVLNGGLVWGGADMIESSIKLTFYPTDERSPCTRAWCMRDEMGGNQSTDMLLQSGVIEHRKLTVQKQRING